MLLLVDSAKGLDDNTQGIVERLKAAGHPAILVLNKVDVARKPKLLEVAAQLNASGASATRSWFRH